MSDSYPLDSVIKAIESASRALDQRKEEINRLNVFPVPDGDTGTNMSLTVDSVVQHVNEVGPDATPSDLKKAIVTGALMGARGNSGVITSQILRGLCEGWGSSMELDSQSMAAAFTKATEVAFQAVRKPVEGTILTVLRDSSEVAERCAESGLGIDESMEAVVAEAFDSVNRTPELLAVLKENGVVDAGAFGLAIFFEAFCNYLTGNQSSMSVESDASHPDVHIELNDDWEGSEYKYCNEFLVDSDTLDVNDALDFLSTMGDCELCVGSTPKFKVHVHSNHPDQVLHYFLERGQIFEVHIHNMDLQAEERTHKLKLEAQSEDDGQIAQSSESEQKDIGFVAVSLGDGCKDIFENLGVDIVVSGGQTMNPSTKDLLDAVNQVNARSVIILPNNSNVILAANATCDMSNKPCGVVPTKSVLEGFSAMFVADDTSTIDENIVEMTQAAEQVSTGEITTAIKDSKDSKSNPIREGDVIGIANGSIDAVGNNVRDVMIDLLESMHAQDFDTLTILSGADFSEEDMDELQGLIEERFPDIEIDPQEGGQPLYPVVFGLE